MTELQLRAARRRLRTECKLGTHVSVGSVGLHTTMTPSCSRECLKMSAIGDWPRGSALSLGTPARPPQRSLTHRSLLSSPMTNLFLLRTNLKIFGAIEVNINQQPKQINTRFWVAWLSLITQKSPRKCNAFSGASSSPGVK